MKAGKTKNVKGKASLIPAFILLAFGLVCIAISMNILFRHYDLQQTGTFVEGIVIDTQKENCGIDVHSTCYFHRVQFTSLESGSYIVKSLGTAAIPIHSVGDKLMVVYPPGHPEKARIKGEGANDYVIFAAFGAGAIVVGFILMFIKPGMKRRS